ncbi:hypothetical protein DV735_g4271, partial [Chaetothyriales sp. CBS 134920]
MSQKQQPEEQPPSSSNREPLDLAKITSVLDPASLPTSLALMIYSRIFELNSLSQPLPNTTATVPRRPPSFISSEFARTDEIRKWHDLVPMSLDLKITDASTCDPVPNLYVEIWHANLTRVQAGL